MGAGHRAHLRTRLLCQHRRADRAGGGGIQLGGIYASHIRNEEEGLLEAIDEAIAIGKSAKVPVHISHLKANGKANWGKAASARPNHRGPACRSARHGRSVPVYRLEHQARRDGGSPTGRTGAMAPSSPGWPRLPTADRCSASRSSASSIGEAGEPRSGSPGTHGGPAGWVATWLPSRTKKRPPRWKSYSTSSATVAPAINFGMSESDVRAIMRHDFVATASDGFSHLPDKGDQPHPRAYGTFPRKIRYALDEHVLSLEQAVRSCTDLPARILGLAERGILRPGGFADLVVFNPATFRDLATFDDPTRDALGVLYLYVNGVAMISEGKPTVNASTRAKLPGRALRLQADGPADLIALAGRVWTGDSANPWAEGVAARDGAIVKIGSREDVLRFKHSRTIVIDRPGAFAMPGLIDAHGHVESLGASLEQVDLRGVSSLDEVARRVQARIESDPGDSWITGRNWDQSLWPGGAFPTAAVLDVVAPGRPVWLRRVDGARGMGQFRGHAQGRSSAGRPWLPPTARSFAMWAVGPPASSWMGRWDSWGALSRLPNPTI